MNPLLPVFAGVSALLAYRQRRRAKRRRLPARTVIVSPRGSTVIARDGNVRSVQSAELTTSPESLDRLWSPTNLENLARTYWAFLTKVTLGLIRVRYSEQDRAVVFLGRPFTLLRFDPPDYVLQGDHGNVSWRIRDGLLVARGGRGGAGFLSLDVRRLGPDKLRIEVEVANFYPSIAAGLSVPVYAATQSVLHVLVTHAFLRSLATLELRESKVGLLAGRAQP
jgi:hypothetical protein